MTAEKPATSGDETLSFEALILPSQFADLGRSEAARSPELQLVGAILDEALRTLLHYANRTGRRAQRLFQESEEWFFVDETTWPFSFLNVCSLLDLDPDYVRLGLRRMLERGKNGRATRLPRRHVIRRGSGKPLSVTARRVDAAMDEAA